MRKQFIKNVLDTEVDGFACTIRYIVRAMYKSAMLRSTATSKEGK